MSGDQGRGARPDWRRNGAAGEASVGVRPAQDGPDFNDFYDRCWPIAWAPARDLLETDEDAEDVCQEIFLRLLEDRRWQDIGAPRSYLRRAGRNAALKHRARAEREVALGRVNVDLVLGRSPDADEVRARHVRSELLIHLLQDFPPRCRAVMTLSYTVGFSRRQAAALLGISVKGVERHVTNGLRLLREKLETPLGRAWLSTFEDVGGVGLEGSLWLDGGRVSLPAPWRGFGAEQFPHHTGVPMKGTILKPTIVLALGLTALAASPPDHSAPHARVVTCNEAYSGFQHCGDEEAEDLFCTAACPDWIGVECEGSTITCSDGN